MRLCLLCTVSIALPWWGACSGDPEPEQHADMRGMGGVDLGPDAPVSIPDLPTLPDPTLEDQGADMDPMTDTPPTWPASAMLVAAPSGPTSARLTWTPAQDDHEVAAYEVFVEQARVARVSGRQFYAQVQGLDPAQMTTLSIVAIDDREQASLMPLTTSFKASVPDPQEVAPPIDASIPASHHEVSRYLYEGPDPIQRDVRPDAITPQRSALVYGFVTDLAEQPVAGVRVHVLDHPELGYTLTREDGRFDLVVNGGGALTLHYTSPGFLASQRRVEPRWNEREFAAPVALLPYDTKVTQLDLRNDPAPVVESSVSTDVDGSRSAMLIFKPNTRASMVLADGSSQPLDVMSVRITEHTVGDSGPAAMPGALPPSSAYTYAASLTSDEAEMAGAQRVEFDQQLSFYIDNFLDFEVGEGVPLGYYNFERGRWEAEPNGVVIKVLGLGQDGQALIDADGDGQAEDAAALMALGFDAVELRELGQRRGVGATLWRTRIDHFTPYDANWGVGCDTDAADCVPPNPNVNKFPGQNGCAFGSILDCQAQTLREHIPLAGTTAMLGYASHYQHGYASKRIERFSLTELSPKGLLGADVLTTVGGERSCLRFKDVGSEELVSQWSGLLSDGRRFNGSIKGNAKVTFYYPLVMRGTVFGRSSGPPSQSSTGATVKGRGVRSAFLNKPFCAGEFSTFFYGVVNLPLLFENWSVEPELLGGWTLTPHHVYDPVAQTLYRGDGAKIKVDQLSGEAVAVAGAGADVIFQEIRDVDPLRVNIGKVNAMTQAPDGSLYIATQGSRVFQMSPDQKTLRSVAGTFLFTGGGYLSGGYNGDEQAAAYSLLNDPYDLALDDQGNLYISDKNNGRIRRVSPTGEIETYAGGGEFLGDEIDARSARLDAPHGIAIGPDGSLYVALPSRACVKRIGPDGIISTAMGVCGQFGSLSAGTRAQDPILQAPVDVKVDAAGNLYVVDRFFEVVWRVDLQGDAKIVVGTGGQQASHQEGAATQVRLTRPTRVMVGSQPGELYISEQRRVVRVLDGYATSYLGDGQAPTEPYQAKLPRHEIRLKDEFTALTQGHLGEVYFSSLNERVVRKIELDPGLKFTNKIIVPDQQGGELYVFDLSGRHLETRSLTNELITRFEYDARGRLTRIRNVDDSGVTVERDASGLPVAIVSSNGARTTLKLSTSPGEAGFLESVTYEDMSSWQLAYYRPGTDAGCVASGDNCEGLLRELTGPRGFTHHYQYDEEGRLLKERGLEGFEQSLTSSSVRGERTSTITDAHGISVTQHTGFEGGVITTTMTASSGLETVTKVRPATGSAEVTFPDGVVTTTLMSASERFGAGLPYAQSVTTRRPSGKSMSSRYQSTVTLADPNDPFSVTQDIEETTITSGAFSATQTTIFDRAQRTLTTRSALGREFVIEADADGRIVERRAPGRAPVQMSYDSDGALVLLQEGDRTISYGYDAQGNVIAEEAIDASTGEVLSSVSLEYNAIGRLTRRLTQDGGAMGFGFDAEGLLTSVLTPNGHTHSLEYDQAGRLATYKEPAVNGQIAQTRFSYNPMGSISSIMMPDGSVVSYAYDAAQRLNRLVGPELDVSMSYDQQTGRMMDKSLAGVSSLSFDWDGDLLIGQRWLDAQDQIIGELTWEYDGLGRMLERKLNGQQPITMAYNLDGQLTQAGALTLSYEATRGELESTTLGQMATTQAFNPHGERSSYVAKWQGGERYALTQSFDAMGRVKTRQESIEGVSAQWAFDYDKAGRLTEVRKDNALSERFGYDLHGNRTSYNNQGVMVTATYDERDRILTHGPRQYVHDANGRRLSVTENGQQTLYRYDARNTLLGVTLPDGRVISYELDPNGSRLGKRVDGVLTRRWLARGQAQIEAELDGTGQVVSRFVYGSLPHSPDYMLRDGKTYRFVHDYLGSVRLVIDVASGQVAQRMDYDAFGQVMLDTTPGFQPFGFVGGMYDPDTKLVRFGLRDYDAYTGRWLEPEPLGLRGGTTNFYLYAFNDPVNMVDVDGELPLLVVVLLGAALSAAFDAAVQYATKGCINYAQVAIAGVIGGVGSGFSAMAGAAWAARASAALRLRRTARLKHALNVHRALKADKAAAVVPKLMEHARALDSKIKALEAAANVAANGGVSAVAAAGQKLLTNSLAMIFNAPGTNNPSSQWDGVMQSAGFAGGFGIVGAGATASAAARGGASNAADVAGMVIERSPISDTYP